MFPKLLKLIIKSRFSWTYFIIIFVFALYGFMSIVLSRLPTGLNYSEYYFSGMLGLFAVMGILMGGLSMNRSDSEFLIVSPVRRRSLGMALYIGQYLYTGPLIAIAFLIYSLTTPYSVDVKLLIILDVLLMSTIPVSLSVASSTISIIYRIPAAALAVFWAFSFLINFPFAPTAMFNGSLYTGFAATIVVSVALLARSLTLLSSDKLAFKVLDRRSGRSDYKRIQKYSELSPRRAIFRYGFFRFEMAARTNFSGTPTLSGRRISILYVAIFFVAAAVLYGYAALKFSPAPGGGPAGLNFVTLLAGIYIGVIPPLMMSSGTLPMERAWLSFTSMRPSTYIPFLTATKMLQLALIMLPFALADLILYLRGVPGTLNSIPIYLLYSPLFLGIFLEINYRVQHYQIKDEKLIVSRYSASQFALIPPVLAFFVADAIASVFPIADIVIIPLFAAAVLIIMFTKGFWDKRLNKLVELGFI